MEVDKLNYDKEVGLSVMQEFLHRCIRCGNKAFEIEPKLFKCSDCGFEWEMF